MKTTVTEIENAFDGLFSWLDTTKKWISEL
jgi:hypothetical protein